MLVKDGRCYREERVLGYSSWVLSGSGGWWVEVTSQQSGSLGGLEAKYVLSIPQHVGYWNEWNARQPLTCLSPKGTRQPCWKTKQNYLILTSFHPPPTPPSLFEITFDFWFITNNTYVDKTVWKRTVTIFTRAKNTIILQCSFTVLHSLSINIAVHYRATLHTEQKDPTSPSHSPPVPHPPPLTPCSLPFIRLAPSPFSHPPASIPLSPSPSFTPSPHPPFSPHPSSSTLFASTPPHGMSFLYFVALTIMTRAFYDGHYVLWDILMVI